MNLISLYKLNEHKLLDRTLEIFIGADIRRWRMLAGRSQTARLVFDTHREKESSRNYRWGEAVHLKSWQGESTKLKETSKPFLAYSETKRDSVTSAHCSYCNT